VPALDCGEAEVEAGMAATGSSTERRVMPDLRMRFMTGIL